MSGPMTAAEMDNCIGHMRRVWGGRLHGDEATDTAEGYATVLLRFDHADVMRAIFHLAEVSKFLPSSAEIVALVRGYISDREMRAVPLGLAAPVNQPTDRAIAQFVGSMRQDRASRRAELRDYARTSDLNGDQLAARQGEVERVSAAEIAAYRALASGHELGMDELFRIASAAGESYASVEDFLAHEDIAAQPPEPVAEGGQDRALPPEPEAEYDAAQIAEEFRSTPELWPQSRRDSLPDEVRVAVRHELQNTKGLS